MKNELLQISGLRCEDLENPVGIDQSIPRLSWMLASPRRGEAQTAYHILVASDKTLLKSNKGDLWDSGRIASSCSQHIKYAGQTLQSGTACHWKVRVWNTSEIPSGWSRPAHWSMGLLKQSDWSAEWIGMPEKAGNMTSPWLRKIFTLTARPEDAEAHVNVMGYCELYINGKKVGDDVLGPHVCDHGKRSFYTSHNVTSLLRKGRNCIAVWLGQGWYRKGMLWPVAHGGPVVRVQLETVKAGTHSRTVTDSTWKTRPSNISQLGDWTYNKFGGERLDASAELPAWNLPSFNDRNWMNAKVIKKINIPACAQMLPPNRIVETVPVKAMKKDGNGAWLVEMKKAVTGWFEIELPPAEPGRVITLEFGDAWERDEIRIPFQDVQSGDKLYSYNQVSEYVYRGSGTELFRNRFNYAGFQFVKISNLPRKPVMSRMAAHLITTDLPIVGEFSCSNKTLNSIHDTMLHTLRCLMLGGYQVDCHSRERLGYGGDGHSSLETTLTMLRSDALYRKWTADWLDAQQPDGEMPHTAPCPYRAGGGPFWCGFLTAASWRNYLHYGDTSLLERNYPAMVKWLKFVEKQTENGLLQKWPEGRYRAWYLGDWATPPGIDQKHPESVDLFCNCFAIYALELSALVAEAIGRKKDANRFRRNAETRRPIVHKTFFNPAAGSYADGDQIDLIMPLLADVTPMDLRKRVFSRFVRELMVKHKGHLATGLSGTYLMIQYLQSIGRDDLVYAFASKTTQPSWGYMIENGATTIWEYWTGVRSRIHNCYNNIGSWFQQGLGGIRPDPTGPGFERIIIRPAILKDLKFVRARYESIRGPIECAWRKTGKRVRVDITIPVGSTATVHLPTRSEDGVMESGKPADAVEGVQPMPSTDGQTTFHVLSGRYAFSFPDPNAGKCAIPADFADARQRMA